MIPRWLNYHHLYYFWVVAKHGSVTRASAELRLSQPSISTQLKTLEQSWGHKLFERSTKGIVLTEFGELVFRYANDIFALGNQLLDAVEGRSKGHFPTLRIGIAEVVPKRISYRLLQPLLAKKNKPHVICVEDRTERLLADLAIHVVDLVLSDSPIPPSVKVKAFNHFLGESGVSFLATEKLAKPLAPDFPRSLHGAPMLLPTHTAAVRRELDHWFDKQEIIPNTVAEFTDSALMKIFAREGHGVIAVPQTIEKDVRRELQLRLVGRTSEVKERFYLISVERRIKHPAVSEIMDFATHRLFA